MEKTVVFYGVEPHIHNEEWLKSELPDNAELVAADRGQGYFEFKLEFDEWWDYLDFLSGFMKSNVAHYTGIYDEYHDDLKRLPEMIKFFTDDPNRRCKVHSSAYYSSNSIEGHTGEGCAVGYFMPDELGQKIDEELGLTSLEELPEEYWWELPPFLKLHHEMMQSFQEWHDNDMTWSVGPERALGIAKHIIEESPTLDEAEIKSILKQL
jgi:hypothetical protein